MKKLTDIYDKMISEGSLKDDPGQRTVLEELEKVNHAISKRKAKSLFFKKTDNLNSYQSCFYSVVLRNLLIQKSITVAVLKKKTLFSRSKNTISFWSKRSFRWRCNFTRHY